MNSIHIFFVDPMSYHNLAGYDYELLSMLDKELQVSFYANTMFNLNLSDIKINKIYSYANKKGPAKAISYLLSQFKLVSDVKKYKPDIVHLQWLKIPLIDYFILRYMKKHTRIIYTSHDTFTHNDEEKYKTVYLKIFELVDHIIVHTAKSKQQLAQIIPEGKISVIKHGILNLANYCAGPLNINLYKTATGLGNEIVFSALGTMDAYKGTDLLIAAWESSAILSHSDKVKLIIAGKNKLGLKDANFKANNILLIDHYISDEEFLTLLKLSDLILMPYRQISQSGLLFSALAEGKKVLVSQAGELTDPFQFGQIGWILNNTSIDELRYLLENIYEESQTEQIKPIDQTVLNQIQTAYGWEEISMNTSRLYKKLSIEEKIDYQNDLSYIHG